MSQDDVISEDVVRLEVPVAVALFVGEDAVAANSSDT